MCWLSELLDFWFPKSVESATHSDSGAQPVDIDGEPVEHDWYCEPPEMYLRPELIPSKYDGLPAVEEAERIVGSGR